MKNKVFSDAEYYYGWNVDSVITLWGEVYQISVSAQAYSSMESVTKAQELAYSMYLDNVESIRSIIERLLENTAADKTEAKQRFVPRTLFFERDGSYALLCDDRELPDEGVAVCLSPQTLVVSQDEYL